SPQVVPVTLAIQGATTVTLNPRRATAGTFATATLNGTGFGANEVVDISGGPWAATMAYTDANGNLSVTQRVTAVQAGQYTVTVRGRATGLVSTAIFSLSGVSVSPSSAAAGQSTSLRIAGVGFGSTDQVSLS